MRDREQGWGAEDVRPKALPAEAAVDTACWQGSPRVPGSLAMAVRGWKAGRLISGGYRRHSHIEKGCPGS